MRSGQNHYGVTTNHMLYYATGVGAHTEFNKSNFNNSLKKLISRQLISVEHSFGVQDRILNLEPLHINRDINKTFVVIDTSEMQEILNGCGINKFSVLRYFILLVGTFNPKIEVELITKENKSNFLGTMSIEYLAKLMSLSSSTIIAYNKLLESFGLIYIYHAKDFYRTSENTIKSPSNVYGRYCDKAFVDQFVKIQAHNKNYEVYGKEEKITTNHKRRLTQRYNRIASGLGNYSSDEVKEVYDHILSENKKYIAMYEENKWEPYKEKIRDLSKLEEFLKGEINY